MSYAVKRVQKFAASPDHPQTATVYDFACLFTHDLKRKAKRWQDGKLKYHTFNKKVIVYDDRGHFVGDAHWDGEEDVVEGDELELDRGGVMVQVADCKGEREQDLTEVLDKRAREVEKRRQQAAAKAPRQNTNPAVVAAARRQQHLPLSGLLQSPGPIGRAAIPDRSPFEARRQVLSHIGEPKETPHKSSAPPAKKRRLSPSPPSKAGFAQSLFGTKLSLSATPSAELLAARARALRERTNLQESREIEAQQATRPANKKSVLKGFQPSTLRAMGMSAEEPVQIEEESESEEEPERTSHYFEQRPKSKQRILESHPSEKPSIRSARDIVTETKRDSQPATSSPQQSSPTTRFEQQAPKISKGSMKRVPSFDIRDTTPSPPKPKNRKTKPALPPQRSPSPPPKSKIAKKKPVPLPSRSPSPARSPSPPPKTDIARQRSEILESDSGRQARKEAKEKRRAARAEAKQQKNDGETHEEREKERPIRNEPRTELRIRARKHRGLLMMNETLPPPRPPRELSPEAPPIRLAKSPELHSRNVLPPPPPRRRLKRASPEVEPEAVPELSDDPEVIGVEPCPKPSPPFQRPITTFQETEVEVPSSPVNKVIPPSPHKNENKSTNATHGKLEDSQDIYTASIPSTALEPEFKIELPVAESSADKAEDSEDIYNASIPSTMPEAEADIAAPDPVAENPQESRDVANVSPLPSAPEPGADIPASESAVNKATSIVLLDSSPAKSEVLVSIHKVAEQLRLEASKTPPTEPPATEPISDAEDDSPLPTRRNLRRKVPKPSKSYTIDSEDEDEDETMPDGHEPQAEESEQVEAPAPPPPAAPQGPRIARMARKSVKSREIFGFVPENMPGIMPMQFAKATIQLGNWKDVRIDTEPKAAEIIPAVTEPQVVKQIPNETRACVEPEAKQDSPVPREASMNENENRASQAAKTIAEPPILITEKEDTSSVPLPTTKLAKDDVSPESTSMDGATRPRIVNPATRGKKAARKEDAAGKVPQTFVPFEPPRIIPRIAVIPQPEPRRTERPSVALPNFVAASGGAWSIHAHDLLGIARPPQRQK